MNHLRVHNEPLEGWSGPSRINFQNYEPFIILELNSTTYVMIHLCMIIDHSPGGEL
jgi:hypothetical protein